MTTLTELHVTILETLASAIEAKEELMDVSKGPKEKHSNYMVSAIVLGSDLTDEEFSECRVYLKDNAIPVGTINQIARFMAPNEGNDKLYKLLKGCESKTLEDRLDYLENVHIVSYADLRKACITVSEEAVNKRLAKQLAGMSSERVSKIVDQANTLRVEVEAKAQKDDPKIIKTEVSEISIATAKNNKRSKKANTKPSKKVADILKAELEIIDAKIGKKMADAA